MSNINEALKKAQKEKDARSLKYSGILLGRGKVGKLFGGRVLWGSLLLLIAVLLAFTSYSWLDSGVQRPLAPAKSKPLTIASKRKSAGNPKTLYERARYFHKSGRLQDARRLYQKTLRLDPGYVDALNNLGVIYIQDKDYGAARSTLQKAIRLKPGHVDAHYNLACLNAIKGELRESLVHLKKAVSLDNSARGWARKDTDLINLRGVPEFEEIIAKSGTSKR